MFIRYKNYSILSIRFYATEKPPKELRLSFQRPVPKPCVGFRGNHQHGKKLYDQVYPTTKIPTSIIPRYPLDWRNAGRFILTAALARIEGKRLYRHPHSLNYQSSTHCGDICNGNCPSSHYKCLCSMRCAENQQHISNIDSLLTSFKGPMDTSKPIFTVTNPVARKNLHQSNKLSTDPSGSRYMILRKMYRYKVFNDRNNKPTSNYDSAVSHTSGNEIFNVKSL